MRKGQAEIFGILIAAIMVVVLILAANPSDQKETKDHNEERAMAAMLSTTFNCKGQEKPVIDFIRLCPEECGCAAVAIDYLLPLAGRRHSMEILRDGVILFQRETTACAKKSLLIPSDNETFEMRLGLC
jgi:hypothetical protein